MKVAVINFSGNVGKTTVARHLLAPRIPGCQVVSVESINADDGQPLTIRGRQFAQLQEFLQSVDDVVIDIGASNVEEMLKLMRRYRGSHEDFDVFVVPTVPARKQQQDTAATLAELARMGTPAERVRLVFNQVDDDLPVEQAFETLLAYCSQSCVVHMRTAAFMTYNEVYARIRGTGESLLDLAADVTDYKAVISKAESMSDKLSLVQKLATRRLARGVVPELDACFAALELQTCLEREPGEAVLPVT